ncbi:MAG: choice-of-anchor U domain-containing protein [bacterium]
MVDANGNWHLKGDPSYLWSGSGIKTSFTSPGVLSNGFQPTFTLAKAPNTTAISDQVGLIYSAGGTNFTAPEPITSFTATDTSGKTIATLTPNSIWKANQLAQSSSNPFTYAANEAGIAGANAGSYTLDGDTVKAYKNIADSWDSGGVVGDYLSLLNAGLLGATGSFTYNQQQVTIGDLYQLQEPEKGSPWFDKTSGPVAKGFFGQTAWAEGDQDNSYWNTWSSLLNTYAPNVYSFGLSDRFANSYDINLNLEEITPGGGDIFLQYNKDATKAESAFSVVDGGSIQGGLYPLFIEYQIGGFGQQSDKGYNYNYDFLPDYNQTRAIVNVPTPQGEKEIRVEFQGGQLSEGSDVEIISNPGINQATLQDLASLGVRTNATAIAFQLATDPGAEASLSSDPNLVAAEFLADLRDPFGRLPARKLLYYALNTATGALSPLSYDPITGAGARFFDLNNDGTPDFFTLSLIDGGYGDKDGLANGVIVDPSVAGFVDLANLQFTSAGSGTVTVSDPSNAAPAAVNLRATLNSRPNSSNQIG